MTKSKTNLMNTEQQPISYAVVIGGANIDICGLAQQTLKVGDSNPGSIITSAGGVGRNIADNLARLGGRVQFIGAMGDDKWGEQLQQACVDANVGTEHCVIIPKATTSTYLSIHAPQGEMYIALNDMALIEHINPTTLSQRNAVISGASVIIIDTNLSEQALEYIFGTYSNIPIMVDPVSSFKAAKLLPYLERIHTLKPNQAEAEVLSDISIKSDADLPRVAKVLHDRGVKHLLISMGSAGVFISSEQEQKRLTLLTNKITNVTGAGDALMAGLAHGYLNAWHWKKSVHFALAAAHLTLKSEDTVSKTMSEPVIQQLMNEHSPREITLCK
ncbi:PfkB family carbohydrate kinase [Aliivibrio sp. S2MY1]|uniref:PfkB family carbohydrate kinase n=1 Tax=Aliivibrio sp. S2MY1 TaxID=3028423 RepID=UPI002377DF1A|nr:PfkB family carbohydrate kinase [Aliivibrio sp. S2MY1]MDD9199149.1 PfkB family carbohydrate kinase [Aliivibrio sp. S2MY1]